MSESLVHWSRIVTDGAILSVVECLLIFASLWANPRIWLNDFPPDIRRAVPPKTAAEKRQSVMWGLPILGAMLAIPAISTVLLERELGNASFSALFLNAFGVGLVFNAVDLLIIDWLVICAWTPRALMLPGTEGMAGYKDYWHHFRGFLIGTALCAVLGALTAAAVYFT
jgi:hypothetical protein